MKIVKVRGITSLVLLVLFVIVMFTGIGLFVAPRGYIARQMGWTFFGMSKEALEVWHDYCGFAMGAVVVLHFILNYKLFVNEIKALFK